MAAVSISEMNGASEVARTDLFEIAAVNAQSSSGYSSYKQALGDIADAINGDFIFSDLDTTDKTIVGAINEIAAGGGGTVVTELTGKLSAGSTSITLTDAAITETGDHTIDLYTSAYGVNPTSVTVVEGSITMTFEPQAADLWVGVVIRDMYNETKTLQGTTLTATLEAGQTTLTFTNNNILSTSMLFITAQNALVSPKTADTSITNQVTYTFNAQADDVIFKLLIVNG